MNREDQFIPHLIVSDGRAALEFYQQVFGAEEGDSMIEPDGQRLMHGEIVLDGHKLFLSDEFSDKEGGTCKMPQTLGGTSVRITLQVADMFWGARYGKIVDPFGHEWGINQQVREQSAEETDARANEFFAGRK